MTNISDGPFRDGVEKPHTGVIRETYTRLSMRDGQLVEETYTRHWTSDSYIDSSTVSPLKQSERD